MNYLNKSGILFGTGLQLFINQKISTPIPSFLLLTIKQNDPSEYFQGIMVSQEHLKQQQAPFLLSSEDGQSYE